MKVFETFLKKMDATDPEKVVASLHALYEKIGDLNDEELVAAYFTLMTLKESSEMPGHPGFKWIRQAILDQMQREIDKYNLGAGIRKDLHELFERITSEAFKQ